MEKWKKDALIAKNANTALQDIFNNKRDLIKIKYCTICHSLSTNDCPNIILEGKASELTIIYRIIPNSVCGISSFNIIALITRFFIYLLSNLSACYGLYKWRNSTQQWQISFSTKVEQ